MALIFARYCKVCYSDVSAIQIPIVVNILLLHFRFLKLSLEWQPEKWQHHQVREQIYLFIYLLGANIVRMIWDVKRDFYKQ